MMKERKKITSANGTQNDCYALCSIDDDWGSKEISDFVDDHLQSHGTSQCSYGAMIFFLLSMYMLDRSQSAKCLSPLSISLDSCVHTCISRDCENTLCFIGIDARSSVRV